MNPLLLLLVVAGLLILAWGVRCLLESCEASLDLLLIGPKSAGPAWLEGKPRP